MLHFGDSCTISKCSLLLSLLPDLQSVIFDVIFAKRLQLTEGSDDSLHLSAIEYFLFEACMLVWASMEYQLNLGIKMIPICHEAWLRDNLMFVFICHLFLCTLPGGEHVDKRIIDIFCSDSTALKCCHYFPLLDIVASLYPKGHIFYICILRNRIGMLLRINCLKCCLYFSVLLIYLVFSLLLYLHRCIFLSMFYKCEICV